MEAYVLIIKLIIPKKETKIYPKGERKKQKERMKEQQGFLHDPSIYGAYILINP